MLRASAETWAGVSKKVQISPVHSIYVLHNAHTVKKKYNTGRPDILQMGL
jgi:hypothetical protein